MVQQFQSRVLGGDWTLVSKRMLEILGDSARSRIGRWIRAARHIHPELLSDLQRMPTLPDTMVFSNQYLVTDKERDRLDVESARKALDYASQAIHDGKPLTGPDFLKDICAPLRAVQSWKSALVKKYGQLADNPATLRVVQFLQSPRGLKQVVLVLKENTPLHGASSENPGIQDCRALVTELQKLKEKGTEGSTSGLASSSAGASSQPATSTSADDPMEVEVDAIQLETVAEEVDPEEAALQQTAQKEFDNVHIITDRTTFLPHLAGRLFSSQRVIFLIDAPTSRIKVVSEYIDLIQQASAAGKIDKYVIGVTAGRRYDLLAAIQAKVASSFPKIPAFTSILVAGENQTLRVSSQFLALLIKGEEPNAPASAPLLKCRAKAMECLRLRCLSRQCAHRSTAELASVVGDTGPASVQQEIHPDDREVDDEGVFEEDESDAAATNGKRDFVVDLWPFSRPESFYKQLLMLLGATKSQVLVAASSTAHPNLLIAARDLKLQVHLLVDRQVVPPRVCYVVIVTYS
jgi:hypothetical protein